MWIMTAITNIYLAQSKLQSTLYCINLLNDKSITFQDFMMRSCYETCLKSTWIKHVTVIISIKSCSAQKKKNHKGPEVTSTAFNFWQISHLCSVSNLFWACWVSILQISSDFQQQLWILNEIHHAFATNCSPFPAQERHVQVEEKKLVMNCIPPRQSRRK